eukprot:6181275-Pleurochrysis_carterae.AAC.1
MRSGNGLCLEKGRLCCGRGHFCYVRLSPEWRDETSPRKGCHCRGRLAFSHQLGKLAFSHQSVSAAVGHCAGHCTIRVSAALKAQLSRLLRSTRRAALVRPSPLECAQRNPSMDARGRRRCTLSRSEFWSRLLAAQVQFVGEEGIDEGGVQKEFFQLIMAQIFDVNYGMFTYDEELRVYWCAAVGYGPRTLC